MLNGMETAKLAWSRLPNSEDGEEDEVGVSKKIDGSSVESLDYEVIENHAYREEQEQYWKKSGQIPAFGNWENANELPITQYFECARQAVSGGLLRYSNSSSGECHCHPYVSGGGGDQLRAIDFKKYPLPTTGLPPPPPKDLRCYRRCRLRYSLSRLLQDL